MKPNAVLALLFIVTGMFFGLIAGAVRIIPDLPRELNDKADSTLIGSTNSIVTGIAPFLLLA
jgi:hypothetical protein